MEEIIDTFMRLFINRTDTYAFQKDDGTYIRIDDELTKDIVKRHLSGEVTIGVYEIDPTNDMVKWVCLDIDPERVPGASEVAKSLYARAVGTLPKEAVWLEASRYPEESYHIWAFFGSSVPADVARWIAIQWNKEAGHENVEVFPKQDKIDGRFGNLVKLPLGMHRVRKLRSRFLDAETMKPLPNEEILKAIPANLAKEQIKEIRRQIGMEKQKRVEPSAKTLEGETKNLDINEIPCVKAFIETPIPPSMRHNIPAKNFAILYYQTYGNWNGFENFAERARGSWEGFEEWAEKLATNKPQFSAKDIIGWKSWVEERPRRLNCTEIRKFLIKYVPGFVCNGSCFKWQQRSYRAFLRRVEKL